MSFILPYFISVSVNSLFMEYIFKPLSFRLKKLFGNFDVLLEKII